jgi:hypothetical protein
MAQQTPPRLKKIREMRIELKRLEFALMRAESVFISHGTRPVGKLDIKAIEGWVLSILESYIVLLFTNTPQELDRNIAMQRLYDFIGKHRDRFYRVPGTIDLDAKPAPYYPDMIDRYG